MSLCEYGCGKKSNFILKNGRFCCESTPCKCLKVREKNTAGLKKAYIEGRLSKHSGFTDEGRKKSNEKKVLLAIKKAFVENSEYDNVFIKDKLLNHFKIKYECGICKLSVWLNKSISLELDHVNGNSNDNRLENLRFLCPNCHSQTNNFRGRNINNGKTIIDDGTLLHLLKTEKNIRRALIKSGLAAKGGNYFRCQKLLGLI